MADTDNRKNVFRRVQVEKEVVEVYFRIEQANLFFDDISKVFFVDGHGLFLTPQIKSYIFDIRRLMCIWCEVAKKTGEENELKIINQEIFKKIIDKKDGLSKELRKYIEDKFLI